LVCLVVSSHLGLSLYCVLSWASKPFENGATVQPIRKSLETPTAGTSAVVSGWGSLSYGGICSPLVQQVQISFVDVNKCSSLYWMYGPIPRRMICAGASQGGRDTRQGDSGSPLVAEGNLVCIGSWGIGCGVKNSPGVYVDVSALRSWVIKFLQDKQLIEVSLYFPTLVHIVSRYTQTLIIYPFLLLMNVLSFCLHSILLCLLFLEQIVIYLYPCNHGNEKADVCCVSN
jgi:hypothetical protein